MSRWLRLWAIAAALAAGASVCEWIVPAHAAAIALSLMSAVYVGLALGEMELDYWRGRVRDSDVRLRECLAWRQEEAWIRQSRGRAPGSGAGCPRPLDYDDAGCPSVTSARKGLQKAVETMRPPRG